MSIVLLDTIVTISIIRPLVFIHTSDNKSYM